MLTRMRRIIVLLYTLFYFVNSPVNGKVGCVWNLNNDLPSRDPLYFSYPGNDSNALVQPTKNGIEINLNSQLRLVCAGKKNALQGMEIQEKIVRCAGSNKIYYKGGRVKLNEAECSSSVQSDVQFTDIPCAMDKGEIINIGFNTSSGMTTLFQVCYDRLYDTIFYAMNTISRNIANHQISATDRPKFKTAGLTNPTAVSKQYEQKEQEKTFTELLGPEQAKKLIINNLSYLARGHVVPDGDIMLNSWSNSTYYYVNAAPEWQAVNNGNWLRVESLARTTATRRDEDIIVYTGVYDVLELPSDTGEMVKMYMLSENRLRIPKFYWKAIYSKSTGEGIAFVTLNNPHVISVDETDIICKNVCSVYGWDNTEWQKYSKGYTYCCEINELASVVNVLPDLPVIAPMQNNGLFDEETLVEEFSSLLDVA